MGEAPAERVREVLKSLLANNFNGNKAALARALGRSPTAVNDLLEGHVNPSFDSICKIAALAGCTEGDLFFGDRGAAARADATTDAHPNLTLLLQRLDGLVSPELVRLLHQHAPVGSADMTEQRWFDTLVALKVTQSLGVLLPWPKRGE
jgi:transcriptional regulator with XRE-family HTH domain